MVVHTTELLNALQVLADDNNLRVSVKESLKGGLIAGSCAAAGGLIGGPIGLAIGGTFGAIFAGIQGHGKYRSVAEVIKHDMSPAQKEALVNSVYRALQDVRPEDAVVLLPLLLQTASLRQEALRALTSFIQNEMRMEVII